MNNKIAALFGALLAICTIAEGQTTLALEDVIQLAIGQAPSSKEAETRKETFYWQYRLFKSNYNPSLTMFGNLPGYNKDFFQVSQDDGTFAFRSREQISSSISFALAQPIHYTGGTLSVNTRFEQFNNLVADDDEINPIYNTTVVNIQLFQPIFGFNDLKWDRRIEPLRYEESKRSYVEQMEFISRRATDLYFDYLDAQTGLQIAQFNLANDEANYNIEQGRYNIGTASKDQLLQLELQVLRDQQSVTQASLDLRLARLALRSFIGLQENAERELDLVLPQELPDFDIPLDQALEYARQNRADYMQFERNRLEAERDLAEAKASRNQTGLVASFGLNDAGGSISEAYENPNQQQRFNIQLNIPIVDWGRSKSRVGIARANQQLTQYTLAQEILNFEQEIITIVGQFEVLRANVEIARKSDEVAKERYDVAQNRYVIGKTNITDLNIAQTQKDEAVRNYVGALRQFWIAYYDLRRLTLYDFIEDELLYVVNE